jgi:hypothetical protein
MKSMGRNFGKYADFSITNYRLRAPFSSLFTDTHTNGRETGSNWVDLSLFGQILIVPGAVNSEIEGKGKFRNQLFLSTH